MSTAWLQRKVRLRELLDCRRDEGEEGEAVLLDKVLLGTGVNGRSEITAQVERVRFSDKDVDFMGALAVGQFGTAELVNCKLNGQVYVRKRIVKKNALKSQDQFSPQTERHLLLLALKDKSNWVPRMLCAYQCDTYLNFVMEYAEGGSLWDVIESSPNEGRISASDLKWWIPQCVSAIHWCHTKQFVHRDIKPHNFVLRPDGRLLLIDFGSAAPLSSPLENGVQLVPNEYCLVPCGTCDYISPEILMAHEEALVALEMSTDEKENTSGNPYKKHYDKDSKIDNEKCSYGRETDWWSLGAMIYEMAYGVAPFFANDIRQTYTRIMNHKASLKFDSNVTIPPTLIALIRGFLTHPKSRLGRYSVDDIRKQDFFDAINWSTLHTQIAPPDLLLPQFTYTAPLTAQPAYPRDNSSNTSDSSKPFAFSNLFQSSVTSKAASAPSLSFLNTTPGFGRQNLSRAVSSMHKAGSNFIGFSWGPPKEAFDSSSHLTPTFPSSRLTGPSHLPSPGDIFKANAFNTPLRPSKLSPNALSTIRVARAVSSARRSMQRPVSDREALKQLVDCIGMSARRRVIESGRKPKILLPRFDIHSRMRPRASSYSTDTVRKELRFDDTTHNRNYSEMSGRSQYITVDNTDSSLDTDQPPSPSPSPRPGSAMSMISMSRRSATPTVTNSFPLVRTHSEPPSTGTGTWTGLGTATSTLLTPTSYIEDTIPYMAACEQSSSLPLPPEDSDSEEDPLEPAILYGDMERRYVRLMSDISLMKVRLEATTRRLRYEEQTI